MDIIVRKDILPDLRICTAKQVPCLVFEHRVFVCDTDEFNVILPFLVGNICQIRIPLLTVFADGEGVVEVVLLEELLGVVVTVDVDLRKSAENRGISSRHLLRYEVWMDLLVNRLLLIPCSQGSLKERQQKLQTIPRLDLRNELIDRYRLWRDRVQEPLDLIRRT